MMIGLTVPIVDWDVSGDTVVAIVAIPAGFIVGLIVSRVVHRFLTGPTKPKPLHDAAAPLSSLALWLCVIVGLLVTLGIIAPASRDQMTSDFVSFVPKLITAAIIVIGASVAASFATAALGPALGRASTSAQNQVVGGVKALIVGIAAIVALTQLGIDATVVNILVAAFFFGIAGGVALLIGMGGQTVAGEVAASRALRRIVDIGDQIEADKVTGKVMNMHPTTIEVKDASGSIVLVPSSELVSGPIKVTRA